MTTNQAPKLQVEVLTIGQLRTSLAQLLHDREVAEQALIDVAFPSGNISDFDLRYSAWAATDAKVTQCEIMIRNVFMDAMYTRKARKEKAMNDAYLAEARRLNAATPPPAKRARRA
jgi:hypothetical protein